MAGDVLVFAFLQTRPRSLLIASPHAATSTPAAPAHPSPSVYTNTTRPATRTAVMTASIGLFVGFRRCRRIDLRSEDAQKTADNSTRRRHFHSVDKDSHDSVACSSGDALLYIFSQVERTAPLKPLRIAAQMSHRHVPFRRPGLRCRAAEPKSRVRCGLFLCPKCRLLVCSVFVLAFFLNHHQLLLRHCWRTVRRMSRTASAIRPCTTNYSYANHSAYTAEHRHRKRIHSPSTFNRLQHEHDHYDTNKYPTTA